jgi:NADPH-dependent curcumin reductase CurA
VTTAPHSGCPGTLKAEAAKLGCDVTVSTHPPITASPYGVTAFKCPHGVDYYMEPTGEQIAHWVATHTP